jgi:magnesium-transporting ATPase (P-type)
MLFAGSAVASGSGTGVVTATGMATEIGKIQSDIQVGTWGAGFETDAPSDCRSACFLFEVAFAAARTGLHPHSWRARKL